MTLPPDWMSAASGGVKTLLGTWTGTASGTGTAGHYRIIGTGAVCDRQGSVTASGGGGDFTVDNVSIASGQTVTVSGFTDTALGA